MEIAEILEQAADIIETHGHVKHILWDNLGRCCAVGAVRKTVCGEGVDSYLAVRGAMEAVTKNLHLSNPMGSWEAVVQWNNHPDRTGAEVVDAFRRTAKDLRNEAVPA